MSCFSSENVNVKVLITKERFLGDKEQMLFCLFRMTTWRIIEFEPAHSDYLYSTRNIFCRTTEQTVTGWSACCNGPARSDHIALSAKRAKVTNTVWKHLLSLSLNVNYSLRLETGYETWTDKLMHTKKLIKKLMIIILTY